MAALGAMTVDDLVAVAGSLRQAGDGASCMEEVARDVVDCLVRELVDDRGGPACALVRLYVTARFDELEVPLQDVVRKAADAAGTAQLLTGATRCVTLLATAGLEPAWNDRTASSGHRAIPLLDEEHVNRLPMVAGLLRGLGVDPASVIRPDPRQHAARAARRYEVFFVAEARTSPFIPDKEFVERYGIRSAVGFGGVLPSGELFAVLLFATVPLPEATAELLRSLALTVQSVVLLHTYRLFQPRTA